MSDTLESLRHKMNGAGELKSVVHSMKVLAAANIAQYEKAVVSLADYSRATELALATCFRHGATVPPPSRKGRRTVGAIVFGSDQGLIGQFNDVLVEYFERELVQPEKPLTIWAVGERVESRLRESGYSIAGTFSLPNSVAAIVPLATKLLVASEKAYEQHRITELWLVHHQTQGGASYAPASRLLLPLDEVWQTRLTRLPWPTKNPPEVLGDYRVVMPSLVRDYFFISLFRACAQSLASENASRLAAMQRAEKNIDDLLENLNRGYHLLRQDSIDEELFDVISGFEALS